MHRPVFSCPRQGDTLAVALAPTNAHAQAHGDETIGSDDVHGHEAPVPDGACAGGPDEGDVSSDSSIPPEELATVVPAKGDIILTRGWTLTLGSRRATWDRGEEAVSSDSSGAADRQECDYLALIVEMTSGTGEDVTGRVKYARDPVPCRSHPMRAKSEWNSWVGEERQVFFSFKKSHGRLDRLLRQGDFEAGTFVEWSPMDDKDLRDLEARVRQSSNVADQSVDKDTVTAELGQLRDGMYQMQKAIDRLRDEREEVANKPAVSVPACVPFFRCYARMELHSSLERPEKNKPTRDVAEAAKSDMGGEDGLGVVASTTWRTHRDGEGICFSLKMFEDLCEHVCSGLLAAKEDSLLSVEGRVRIKPDLYTMRWDTSRPEFRMCFATYGDFCEACEVSETMRHVHLWHSWCPVGHDEVACLVGSQLVVREDNATDPGVRASTRRIVLLGQSWSSLMERQDSCSLDWLVDCLVQNSVAYVPSSETCRSPFEHEQLRVSELLRCVREGAIVSENLSLPFSIVWTASGRGPPRRDRVEVAAECIPGKISFEIPVVVVRTKALVQSALRVVGSTEVSFLGAEVPARSTSVERLRARVSRPPDTTSRTGQAANVAPNAQLEGNAA